eukprot:TRINITY_DN3391_c0_g2_i2.p1 TRINITY_DN3391_c0_g2~~TRINITY_DN3391_c0_g2_i2.p1  ORF type:complete len:551 (+),score=200.74 TRINITY_DN3391_c0_g2_i2:22-1674(+)
MENESTIKQILINRKTGIWICLIASCLIATCSGSVYSFSLTSQFYKSEFGYSQKELNVVANLGNLGVFLSITGGLIIDRFGVSVATIMGSFLTLTGLILQYLLLCGKVSNSYIVNGVFQFITQQGSSWAGLSAVSASVYNFAAVDQGKAVGIVKGYVGLSASVITQFYVCFFGGAEPKPEFTNVQNFTLFLAIFLASVTFTCGSVIRKIGRPPQTFAKKDAKIENNYLKFLLIIAIIFAIALGIISILQAIKKPLTSFLEFFGVIVFFVQVAIWATLILYALFTFLKKKSDFDSEEAITFAYNPQHDDQKNDFILSTSPVAKISIYSIENRDHNLFSTIKNVEFWLIFSITFCITGTSFMVNNNLTQIANAVLGESSSSAIFVTINSIGNFFGRVTSTIASDYLSSKFHRPSFILIATSIVFISQLCFIIFSEPFLYIGIGLCGFGFGAVLTMEVVMIAEFFGSKHIGSNIGLFDIGNFLGTLVFATLIAGTVYDNHAVESTCFGMDCFFFSLLSNFIACGVAVLLSMVLVLRTRQVVINSSKYSQQQIK